MMDSIDNLKQLFYRLTIVMTLLTLCRGLFFLFYREQFTPITATDAWWVFLSGLRFDAATVIILNIPIILSYLLPIPGRDSRRAHRLIATWFFAVNGIALALNTVDLAYYRFTAKRMTGDIFTIVSTGGDFMRLLPQFNRDYWYLWFVWGGMLLIAYQLYPRYVEQNATEQKKITKNYYLTQSALALALAPLLVIGGRGGLQLKPLSLTDATDYVAPQFVPLVLNSPFSVLRSLSKRQLQSRHYFFKQAAREIFDIKREPSANNFRPLNVVVIILESMSREFVGALNSGHGYTPFIDELIPQSLIFDNAFANGKSSVDGIPAIVASIPSLMVPSFIFSRYGTNHFNSLANLLAAEGYDTSFFHGGNNGTMGFDDFSRLAGYKRYYGKREYNNIGDDDGNWGIWDEEFLQYFGHNLTSFPQPFHATVFTLSAHHPFKVPPRYEGKFPEGTLKIHKVVGYADYALRRFFDFAKSQPWYENTLFVISADHTAEPETKNVQTRVGIYSIPILFFRPNGELVGRYGDVFQQIDIMPSVLDLLGYQKPYVAFGQSLNSTKYPRTALQFRQDIYQLIRGAHVLQFDGDHSVGLYDYTADPLHEHDLRVAEPKLAGSLETQLKATIQVYNSSLINNQLTIDSLIPVSGSAE